MIKRISVLALAVLAAFSVAGCGSNSSKRVDGVLKDAKASGLANENDSLAYIIGMNVAEQLLKVDSTININVVCRAILEQTSGKAFMNLDEARDAYLRYLLYVGPERKRNYEEQYLVDLAKNNRSLTRTKSGLTYNIEVIGDETKQAKNNNDWVVLNYTISRVNGEQIYPVESGQKAQMESGVGDMIVGLAESVKMVGVGGKIKAWIPSKIAFGEDGDAELGVAPIETIIYDLEIVDVESNLARVRKQEPKRF
ncbi:MAG: FKBP-type peptidyl-prolyl cis-trans isomerase [Rikenellaceae bacterium]